jgi:hypothetical protein
MIIDFEMPHTMQHWRLLCIIEWIKQQVPLTMVGTLSGVAGTDDIDKDLPIHFDCTNAYFHELQVFLFYRDNMV